MIVAKRDIHAGEEVTFNYGYDLENYREYPCHCGAANCVGYILAEEFHEQVRQTQTAVRDARRSRNRGSTRGRGRVRNVPGNEV